MNVANAAARPVSQPTAVFICSAKHSGSTLLDLLLGSHLSAMSLGEITHLPKNLALNTVCSCGRPVRECEVWSKIVAKLATLPQFARIHEDPYQLYLGLFEASTVIDRRHQTVWRKLYRRGICAASYAYWRWNARPLAAFAAPLFGGARNKRTLYAVVAESTRKPVLIDSSKHYLEAVALYRSAPKHTKVVLLIRDGRAVFYSALKRGCSRRSALNAWRHTYRRALPLLREHIEPHDLLTVRYEDLATAPAQELQRVCAFIGIPYDESMLEFRSRPHHVVNGNDMRLASATAIKADYKWRSQLSPADLAYFEMRAGSLNRELGYLA